MTGSPNTKRRHLGRTPARLIPPEAAQLYRRCCELEGVDKPEFDKAFWALHKALGHHPWSMLPIAHYPGDVADDGWGMALDEAIAELGENLRARGISEA